MKFCFAILFVFLSSTRTQKFEMSFIIVDLKNTYHLTEKDGTKRFGEKHNMTNTIQFIRAKTYNNGFDSVYGSCSSEVVGYYRKKGNATFFGTVDLTEPFGGVSICGVAPGLKQNTFYVAAKQGYIAIFDGRTRDLSPINSKTTSCRFNLLLNAVKYVLYFLEGSCDPYKSNQLGFQDIYPNSTVKLVTISEHVIKVEIDFLTNEIFAITESNDLKKGNIDSDKVTLESVKNANQKILDIALTLSDIYYIEKDESIIRKMKRSDTEEPVQVFKSLIFDKPQGIAYLHFPNAIPVGNVLAIKSFSTSISLHLAFYFVMLLINMELWNL